MNVINDVSYYYRQHEISRSKETKDEKSYKIIDFCRIIDEKISNLKINLLKKIFWKKMLTFSARYDIISISKRNSERK